MRPWAAASAALLAAACGQADQKTSAPPAAAVASLDCSLGYEALSARIAAMPDLVQAPAPGEPYRYLNHASGNPSYVVTLPGAPAHPAIVMQSSAGGAVSTSGCAWGDMGAYDALLGYIRALKNARGR